MPPTSIDLRLPVVSAEPATSLTRRTVCLRLPVAGVSGGVAAAATVISTEAVTAETMVQADISGYAIERRPHCTPVWVQSDGGERVRTYKAPVADNMLPLGLCGAINGVALAGYVDTGANVCLITRSAAAECGLTVLDAGILLRLADDSTAQPAGAVVASLHVDAYVGDKPVQYTYTGGFVVVDAIPGDFDLLLSARFFISAPVGALVAAQQYGSAVVSYKCVPRRCLPADVEPKPAVETPVQRAFSLTAAREFHDRVAAEARHTSHPAEPAAMPVPLCSHCNVRCSWHACPGCGLVAFCSPACMAAALPAHRSQCAAVAAARPGGSDSGHASALVTLADKLAERSIGTAAFFRKRSAHAETPAVGAMVTALLASQAQRGRHIGAPEAQAALALAKDWSGDLGGRGLIATLPTDSSATAPAAGSPVATAGAAVADALPPGAVRSSDLFRQHVDDEPYTAGDHLADELARREATPPADIARELHKLIDCKVTRKEADMWVDSVLELAAIFGPMSTATVDEQIVVELAESEPVNCGLIPIKPEFKERTSTQLEAMEKDGVIRVSTSRYNNPLLVVRKRGTEELRLCIDLRKLNAITKRIVYQVPTINELLDATFGMRFFSTIDIKSAFHQLKLHPGSQDYFAFWTPRGLRTFNVVPFGWVNAPAVFQRAITRVLMRKFTPEIIAAITAAEGVAPTTTDAMSEGWVRVYMDDILVMSKTAAGHLVRLRWVLECIHAGGMRINVQKCKFMEREVSYLGQIVDGTTRRIDPERVQGLLSLQVPTRLRELQAVMGLYQYYSQFIKDFAKRTTNLRNLCRPNARVAREWTAAHTAEFEDIRDAIIHAVRLYVPDHTRTFYLRTDASVEGLGAYLYQLADDGVTHQPVYFWSRRLNAIERDRNTTEREAMALVEGVQRMSKAYLVPGKQFVVETDHKNLTWMPASVNPRVQRWNAILAGFDFIIQYVKGEENVHADAMSRVALPPMAAAAGAAGPTTAPAPPPGSMADAAAGGAPALPTAPTPAPDALVTAAAQTPVDAPATATVAATGADAPARRLTRAALAADPATAGSVAAPAPAASLIDAAPVAPVEIPSTAPLSLLERIADAQRAAPDHVTKRWRRAGAEERTIAGSTKTILVNRGTYLIPETDKDLVAELVRECHDGMGHYSKDITLGKLVAHHVSWPGMAKDVAAHVDTCYRCVRAKAPVSRRTHVGELGSLPMPEQPFEYIMADYFGPVNIGGKRFILVVLDALSRFVELAVTDTADSATTISVLEPLFHRYGAPRVLQTDGGSHFDSVVVKRFLDKYGVHHHVTTPYNPQSNGMIERRMRIILTHLRIILTPHFAKWPMVVSIIAYHINTTVCGSTGMTPFYIVFGYHPRTALAVKLPPLESETDGTITDRHRAQEEARVNAVKVFAKARDVTKARHESKSSHPTFVPGDFVLVPKPHGEHKLDLPVETPYKILSREADKEVYVVEPIFKGKTRRAHVRDLTLYPMSPMTSGKYRHTEADEYREQGYYFITGVRGHRFTDAGDLYLDIDFHGVSDPAPQRFTVEDHLNNVVVKAYCKAHGLVYDRKADKVVPSAATAGAGTGTVAVGLKAAAAARGKHASAAPALR